ncbi:class I adenylate-forming enzyme family protein [Rhodococcus zopfii]|uniref:class I adenylate-forming enzyme family protein n=1 Tax=Rhodococcus zopfii TaxID=43772 RepID=UPI003526F4FA
MTALRLPVGMPDGLIYPAVGIDALLSGAARRYADRVALIDGDLSLTFAQLHEHALRVAHGLRQLGIRRGDAVALCQPNSAWFTVTYFGSLLAGAVVAPINPTLPPAAIRDQIDEVGATAAIVHASTAPLIEAAAAPTVRLVVAVPATAAAPAPGASTPPAVALDELLAFEPEPAQRISPDDLAHLSFTGGTTGRSKAVRVLHRNVVANALQMATWRSGAVPVVEDDGAVYLEEVPDARTEFMSPLGQACAVTVAPLFHAMGLVTQNLNVIIGGTSVIMGRFDPARFLDLVEEHRATQLSGSPAFFHALLASPALADREFPSVRSLTSGAAPIDTSTLDALRGPFPRAIVVESYGLTEATMGLCSGLLDAGDPTPVGSVGVPVFDTEVEIRDPSAPDTTVATGEVGELYARGPQIADGYLGHPELTAAQFRDGWLLTGDLARRDEQGNIFIVGRAKDMLIYKGYNVYPGQLEEILATHPSVAQAAVIGVPAGDAGEIPVAYVVPTAGTVPDADTAQELLDHVAAQVAPYQKVREVHFTGALPTSAAGKILKTELRQNHRPAVSR